MWNPEDYAKNSDAQLRWAQQLRSNLDLSQYKSILDVGCGDGKITADFAATSPQSKVTGIDSSPEMVAYAVEKYPQHKYPNLTFECVDARSLKFDREFDLVFSNATLHWVDNHRAFLQGANAALKAGGRLIVSCGGEGNAAQILATFAELTAWRTLESLLSALLQSLFLSRTTRLLNLVRTVELYDRTSGISLKRHDSPRTRRFCWLDPHYLDAFYQICTRREARSLYNSVRGFILG